MTCAVAARHRGGVVARFHPAVGEFVIHGLLGGPDSITIGRAVDRVLPNRDCRCVRRGRAMLVLIVVALIFEYVENRANARPAHESRPFVLYTAMASVCIPHLRSRRHRVLVQQVALVTVWGGLHAWYGRLFENSNPRCGRTQFRDRGAQRTLAVVVGTAPGWRWRGSGDPVAVLL